MVCTHVRSSGLIILNNYNTYITWEGKNDSGELSRRMSYTQIMKENKENIVCWVGVFN